MDISAQRLRYLLTLLAEVAPKKPQLPILTNALFRRGEAHVADLNTRMRIAVVESDQQFLMPVRDVLAFIKTVPSYERVHVTLDGARLQVAAGARKAIFPTGKPDEWPSGVEAQPLKEPEVSCDLDGDLFIKGLTSVARYVAVEKSSPALHSVLVELGERETTFVATDGFRISSLALPIGPALPEGKVTQLVLDRDTVATLARVWAAADKPPVAVPDVPVRSIMLARRLASLQYDKGAFHFAFGDVTLQGLVVQGEYPKWRAALPKNPTASVRVLSEELRQAIRPIGRFGGVVRLGWSGNQLTISAWVDEQEFETQLPVRQEGQDGLAGYSFKYLQEYLQDVSGEVLLQWGDLVRPLTLSAPRYPTYYLMPVFLEQKAAPTPAAAPAAGADGQQAPERPVPGPKRNTKTKVKS